MDQLVQKKKRVPSAYNLFVSEHIKNNKDNVLPKDRLRSASVAWKAYKETHK